MSGELIRLTLNKPLGIVFHSMIDPHNSSQKRGVRISDLPRTGAAAMSRKLEVGDELLSINETTVSRMTFDEVMDVIVQSNPKNINLLFRRPRKDQLLPTIHSKKKQQPEVKWSDSTVEKLERRDRNRRRRSRRENGCNDSALYFDKIIDSLCSPILGPAQEEYSDDEEGTYCSSQGGSIIAQEKRRQSGPKNRHMLDKLLIKYKGANSHIINQLSAKYDRHKESKEEAEEEQLKINTTQRQHKEKVRTFAV